MHVYMISEKFMHALIFVKLVKEDYEKLIRNYIVVENVTILLSYSSYSL